MKHSWRTFKFSVSCTRIFYKWHRWISFCRRTLKSCLLVPIYVYQTVLYSVGGRVGFFQGDIRLLPDDMKALKPTVFPVVPRLLNRVYDKVWNYTQSLLGPLPNLHGMVIFYRWNVIHTLTRVYVLTLCPQGYRHWHRKLNTFLHFQKT